MIDSSSFADQLGRAYSERRLTVYEVADALGVSVPDAIVFLEEHGFARTIGVGELSEEKRTEAFARMRSDRLSRRGRPTGAKEIIERNVIASQRIEGIDSRRWFVKK